MALSLRASNIAVGEPAHRSYAIASYSFVAMFPFDQMMIVRISGLSELRKVPKFQPGRASPTALTTRRNHWQITERLTLD